MESIAPSSVGTDLSRDSRNQSLRYEYKTGMVAVKEYTPFAVLTTRIATETSEFPLTCKFVYLSSLKTISRTTKLHSMTLQYLNGKDRFGRNILEVFRRKRTRDI